MRVKRSCVPIVTLLFIAAHSHAVLLAQGRASADRWVGTWATAVVDGSRAQTPGPQPTSTQTSPPAAAARPTAFTDRTLRQIVHISLGGERVRLVLTNAFGTSPLAVGAARIALRDKGPAIVARSDHALTFGGRPAVTIPAGAIVVSDPVNFVVPAAADLAIDLYLSGDAAAADSPVTMHTVALQTNYVSPPGNHAGVVDMPVASTAQNWFYLARVEVTAPAQATAIVTLGDSITDGTRSTPDTNNRWPDHLAKRLGAQNLKIGILNVGISANRLLSEPVGASALSRFERDVLAQTGVSHVVVLEGINDIRRTTVTVADLVFAHKQLIERAHAKGLRIFGATLTPFEGDSQWSADTEARRQGINEWIRTSNAYDGVIDFDAVTRDPNQRTKLLAKYDSGDHLHPSDAGYQAMANAIDVQLFTASRQRETAAAR
jgi:lysophospholipase L1-like esterase